MDIALQVLVFLSAVCVSAAVVQLFSAPMDATLGYVMSGQMAAAWGKYAKFAVFVGSLTAGLRFDEIAAMLTPAVSIGSRVPVGASQCLTQVLKAATGTLTGASWTLLIFFGATLTAYLAIEVFGYLKSTSASSSKSGRPDDRHTGIAAGRL